jgi:hypothetical protein
MKKSRIYLPVSLVIALFFSIPLSTTSWATPSSIPSKNESLKDLNQLKVKAKSYNPTYKRSAFGESWADIDKNGCDTRNDILQRDLFQQVTSFEKGPCIIVSGKLLDPYTNKTINFIRGSSTSILVQIDHVVSLSNAWQTGAYQLTASKRTELANDPQNLIATSGKVNQIKSDKDAASWAPQNQSFHCSYAALTIAVKKKYKLWVTKSEKLALSKMLMSCNA